MVAKREQFPDSALFEWIVSELKKRNIDEYRIGYLAYRSSSKWHPDVDIARFGKELPKVLRKREVQLPIAIGLLLDNLAEEHKLPQPLQDIIEHDMAEFSFDESLAISIANLYGSTAVASFGNLDQHKVGVAKSLDEDTEHVSTFADDIASALASAVCARFGQHSVSKEE